MASQHVRQVRDFLEQSALHVVISASDDVDWDLAFGLTEHRRAREGPRSSAAFPQRDVLFLDEIVPASILLHCPLVDEENFRSYLRSIDITLQTYALGKARDNADDEVAESAPPREPVDSQKVQDVEDPLVVVRDATPESEDASGPQVLVVWKQNVYLNRSRIRTLNPSIFFSASISIRTSDAVGEKEIEDDYLPSGVPDSINVLDALRTIPELRNNPPKLSAERLAKISPAGIGGGELIQQLRNTDQHLLRIVPAVDSRVRFSHLGLSSSQAKVLASLDVTVRYAGCEAVIETLDFSLHDGRAEPLTKLKDLSLPLTCKPRDSLSFIYNLVPNQRHASSAGGTSGGSNSTVPHSVSFTLEATLVLPSGTRLPLKSHWRANVDLSALAKPSVPSLRYDAPSTDPAAAEHIKTHLVTLTVAATTPKPPTKPAVGTTLSWSLLVTNRSRTRRLRLALIPITHSTPAPAAPDPSAAAVGAARPWPTLQLPPDHGRQQHHPARTHRHKPTLSASAFAPRPSSRRPSTSSAVSRSPSPSPSPSPSRPARHALTSLSSTAAGPASLSRSTAASGVGSGTIGVGAAAGTAGAAESAGPGLIPLTADVRVGPLAPGACATAEMRFLVARAGLVGLEALRVVDLEPPAAAADVDGAPAGGGGAGVVGAEAAQGHVEAGGDKGGAAAGARGALLESSRRRFEWVDVPAELLPDVVAVGSEMESEPGARREPAGADVEAETSEPDGKGRDDDDGEYESAEEGSESSE